MTGAAMMWLLPMLASGMPDDAVQFSAKIQADELKRGGKYHITVEVSFVDGVSPADAGVPAPILQIDVPASVRLDGKEIKTLQQLARKDFLQEPFERLLSKDRTRIRFRITDEPKGDERFYLNLLAYVGGPDGQRFVRRRIELPLTPKSEGKSVETSDSGWGNEDVLQIGDEAPDFSLPKGDGSTVSLSQFRGKKNVIVTTYRAYW